MPASEATAAKPRAVAAGALSGGLLALAVVGWPALRAAADGLDAPLLRERWLALAGLLSGALCGLALRAAPRRLLGLGFAVALAAALLAALSAFGFARLGDRGPALWVAFAFGLALGAVLPRPGFGALPFAALVAALGIAACRLLGRGAPPPLGDAALLLAPPLALLLAPAARRPLPLAAPRALVSGAVLAVVSWAALAFGPRPFGGADTGLPLPFGVRWGSAVAGVPAAAGRITVLAGDDSACAAYDRSSQEMQLWSDGFLVDGEGPDRPQSPLLATVVAALSSPGDRVLVLGTGVGRLPAALAAADVAAVADVVVWRTAALPLRPRLAAVGPIVDPRRAADPPAVAFTIGGWRAELARLAAGARQVIVVGEALAPAPAGGGWQCDGAVQAELRRVAGDGLVVQPFAMDRTPPAALRALFRAATAAHPWNGVLAVGECGVLVSATQPPVWPSADAFDGWSAAARWQAHRAHLGGAADLPRAWLGTVRADLPAAAAVDVAAPVGSPPAAGEPGDAAGRCRRETLRVLHDCLVPAPAPPTPTLAAAPSQLLWWVDLHSRMRAFGRALAAAPATAEAGERMRAEMLAFLPTGCGSAELQAALALPDGSGSRLCDPELATLAAFALDPTFYAERPPLLADLPKPKRRYGDLEELAFLPPPARLCELCAGDGSLARALRARFPSAAAQALVAALADGPLPPAQAEALRRLADPFVLAEAGRALAGRGRTAELFGLWRGDLPLPAALAALAHGAVPDRAALAAALAGRTDERALAVLAELLLDDALPVRRAAGRTLAETGRGRIDYDPEWSRGKRFVAAERVRALHNRAP